MSLATPIDTGDTAWLTVSSALVLLMTPGLALFYGGMVRRKNVLSTLMHSMAAIPILSVTWALYGYSLAFGPDVPRAHRGALVRGALGARQRDARHRARALALLRSR